MADYIPANDAKFDQWLKCMNQYVEDKCAGANPAWTRIPQADCAETADVPQSSHLLFREKRRVEAGHGVQRRVINIPYPVRCAAAPYI
ncbi:MAG: hypothetical protein LBP19_05435 [Treponema sp.]|nr:hypothetical protein [Treponema sp.]